MKFAHLFAIPLGFMYALLCIPSCDKQKDNTETDTQASPQQAPNHETSDDTCNSLLWVTPDPDSDLLTKTWPENRRSREWSELSAEEQDRYMKCMDNLFKDSKYSDDLATWYGPPRNMSSSCPGTAIRFPEQRHQHDDAKDDASLSSRSSATSKNDILISNDSSHTTVTANMDKRIVLKILKNHFWELQACVKAFKAQSERIPSDFSTKFYIRLNVSPEGSVTNVTILSTDLKLPTLEACFKRSIEAWRYPKIKEAYEILYIIQLRLPNANEIDQAKEIHPFFPSPSPPINLR